jgi:hypothetical protein
MLINYQQTLLVSPQVQATVSLLPRTLLPSRSAPTLASARPRTLLLVSTTSLHALLLLSVLLVSNLFKDNWHLLNYMRHAVATMSLGRSPADPAIDTAVSNAITRGIHFTISAGNSNVNAANTSPARVAAANTIGAIDSSNRKTSFSNYGRKHILWLFKSITVAQL